MPKYKVFGTKYQTYYTHVTAADEYSAAEAANSAPSSAWFDVESDDLIEATDVFLDEEIDIPQDEDIDYHPGFDKILTT